MDYNMEVKVNELFYEPHGSLRNNVELKKQAAENCVILILLAKQTTNNCILHRCTSISGKIYF